MLAIAIAATVGPLSGALAQDAAAVDLTRRTAPDIRKVGDDAFGRLVKYGHALVTDTANQIGPAASDPAKRLAGNNLTCQSCHLQGGAQPYAMPLIGVWGQFPQYRGREGEVGTLEDRVNGCMERSMNGRALALDSREMKAFLAYMKWLSTGIPDGAKIVGSGTKPVQEPDRAADLRHGAEVYAEKCLACHGDNGQGQRVEARYQFPPLWGPDSYNDGAGMARLLNAAAFAKHNMPFGTTFDTPLLSDEEAYDVAGSSTASRGRTRRTSTRISPTDCRSRSMRRMVHTSTGSARSSTSSARSARSAPGSRSWRRRRSESRLQCERRRTSVAVIGFGVPPPAHLP
jgi:thiosulfate dehydrogenase